MATTRELLENLSKLPYGVSFVLPIIPPADFTEQGEQALLELIKQKKPANIKVTGITALQNWHYQDFHPAFVYLLERLATYPVSRIIFDFGVIGEAENARFVDKILSYLDAYYPVSDSSPLIAGTFTTSDVKFETAYLLSFKRINLPKIMRAYHSQLMQRFYAVEYCTRLLTLGEQHHLSQHSDHAMKCFDVVLKHWESLQKYLEVASEESDKEGAILLDELAEAADKIAYRLGMNYLLKQTPDSLIKAIKLFDAISEISELHDEASDMFISCYQQLLTMAKEYERKHNIGDAYRLYENLSKQPFIGKDEFYEFALFLLDNYNNVEVLKLCNKSSKHLLADLLQQFYAFVAKNPEEFLKQALKKCKQLLSNTPRVGKTTTSTSFIETTVTTPSFITTATAPTPDTFIAPISTVSSIFSSKPRPHTFQLTLYTLSGNPVSPTKMDKNEPVLIYKNKKY